MNKRSVSSLENIFTTGCTLHQKGKFDAALQIYLELLEQVPELPLLLYNIGLTLQELDQPFKAVQYYSQALKHAPDDSDTHFNLALCYQKLNDSTMALSHYKKAHDCSQHETPDIYYNMGCVHQQLDNEESAVSCYEKTLQIDEKHSSALGNLAYLYHKNGQHDKAVPLYKRLLQQQPENHRAQHMLASLTGKKTKSLPRQYIEEIFDNYSSHFEDCLIGQLGYCVPEKLRNLYDDFVKDTHRASSALDLGCGTGLSGLAFHHICDHFTGVDLSANMISKADKKQIYDSLSVSDIMDFLEKDKDRYDLIIAADVMTYLGDLNEVFSSTLNRSNSRCVFCFSTEKSEREPFHLGKTGRFKHSADYLLQTAHKTGWHLVLQTETELRKEKKSWVTGHLTFLMNQPND